MYGYCDLFAVYVHCSALASAFYPQGRHCTGPGAGYCKPGYDGLIAAVHPEEIIKFRLARDAGCGAILPLTPVPRRQRQANYTEFETSLAYTVSSRQARAAK